MLRSITRIPTTTLAMRPPKNNLIGKDGVEKFDNVVSDCFCFLGLGQMIVIVREMPVGETACNEREFNVIIMNLEVAHFRMN